MENGNRTNGLLYNVQQHNYLADTNVQMYNDIV